MVIPVDSLDDPRLAPYRAMKERDLARDGDRFIAEGEMVVRRLLASPLRTESVLVSQRKAEMFCPLVPADIPVWVASDDLIESLIGFAFHSGIMACGVRPESPTWQEVLADTTSPTTLMVCAKIANVDNLGSLVRIAAGFGVHALVLGRQCCDPFFRHAVRVSMGTAFYLPMMRGVDLLTELPSLRERHGFELIATVLSPHAQPLAKATRGKNTAILFGNEADGLDDAHVAMCDRRVTIPMRRGTDSLNVAVAAGICLYHFIDLCDLC